MTQDKTKLNPIVPLIIVVVLGVVFGGSQFLQRNHKPVGSFVGSLADGDYAAASEFLASPSLLLPSPDGD